MPLALLSLAHEEFQNRKSSQLGNIDGFQICRPGSVAAMLQWLGLSCLSIISSTTRTNACNWIFSLYFAADEAQCHRPCCSSNVCPHATILKQLQKSKGRGKGVEHQRDENSKVQCGWWIFEKVQCEWWAVIRTHVFFLTFLIWKSETCDK